MKPSQTDVDVEPADCEPAAWSDMERALFRSGREEAPAATRAAVLGALGLEGGPGPEGGPDGGTRGSAGRPSSASPSMAANPARRAAAQWLVGGLLVAALPTAWLLSSRSEQAQPAPYAEAAHDSTAGVAHTAPAPHQDASPPTKDTPLAAEAPNGAPNAPAPATQAMAASTPAPSSKQSPAATQNAKSDAAKSGTSSLPEELAMIRSARSALAAGRATESLQILDRYSVRFERPQLGQEAAMVRIEALLKSGRRDEARRVAAPIIASGSVHAARARSLVEAAP